MTLTLHRSNVIPGMNSVSPVLSSDIKPVSIDNMEAIKISTHKVSRSNNNNHNSKQLSFRTLGETAPLSEASSTESLSPDELEDAVCFKPLLSSLPPSRRSSILKPSSEEIPLNLKSKAFKTLPPPDMSKIKSHASVAIEETRPKKHLSDVSFASVQIREYDQTIGDNPSVSYGPPISLDWDYTQLESVTLEHYEAHRGPRRTLRQMCMNYYTRRNVLTFKWGYPEEQVKMASKQADKCKRERAVTKYFLPYAKVEDFVSSAGRKAKRGFQKSQVI